MTLSPDNPARIRVLLVDDHPMVRMGLRAMLESDTDFDVVGEAENGRDALDCINTLTAQRRAPDVVLTDLRMPELDGVGLTAAVTRTHPEMHVLVVTTYETDADILRAVEAGAAGYLLKDAPPADLCAAVRSAARGETVLAPSVAARLMARLRTPAVDALTPRELDVLRAVAEGHTNAEIGRRLFIGESTVKTHLLRVFAKLGVDDRTAAVTVAMKQGVLD
jgi:DNA-binding NarL/FixJ family response regulator